LFFGELLQTVYPIRPFDISISTWYVMRNWLFVGMPFVLIGVLFGDYIHGLKERLGSEEYVERSKRFFTPALIGVISGCVISYVEMLIMGGKDVYIGSLIIVVSLLFMSECGIEAPDKLVFLGKESSSSIYFYHVMIIAVMDHLSQNGIIPDYSMMLKPFLVMIICTLLFGFIPWMFKKVKTNE
jgi:hypothetical protein